MCACKSSVWKGCGQEPRLPIKSPTRYLMGKGAHCSLPPEMVLWPVRRFSTCHSLVGCPFALMRCDSEATLMMGNVGKLPGHSIPQRGVKIVLKLHPPTPRSRYFHVWFICIFSPPSPLTKYIRSTLLKKASPSPPPPPHTHSPSCHSTIRRCYCCSANFYFLVIIQIINIKILKTKTINL